MIALGVPGAIIFLLDDTGFAHLGSFGGLVETPNIDRLAENGLRYNNFHTTALCSPSRATIMAGRNHHRIGLGSHSLTAAQNRARTSAFRRSAHGCSSRCRRWSGPDRPLDTRHRARKMVRVEEHDGAGPELPEWRPACAGTTTFARLPHRARPGKGEVDLAILGIPWHPERAGAV